MSRGGAARERSQRKPPLRLTLPPAKSEIDKGLERVGLAAEARARWLLGFIKRDLTAQTLASLPKAELSDLSWDAMMFSRGPYGHSMVAREDFPDGRDLRRAQARVLEILERVTENRGVADVRTVGWAGRLSNRDGVVTGESVPGWLSFLDGFVYQAYTVLASLWSEGRCRLRACSNCKKPFIAKRESATTCSVSCRTLEWRRRNPEKFAAARRRYYHRMLAKKLGKPVEKVRVQSRGESEGR